MDLAEIAELVVSELAGNATLHAAARFMYVTVTSYPEHGRVRVAVEDDGSVPADAVTPRPLLMVDDLDDWTEPATTGRGLAIVSMLAVDWGVEATPRGKRVWADLMQPDAVHDVRPPRRPDPGPAAEEPVGGLPAGWTLVRLAGCPVQLSLEQDQHLDELVRELQLVAADRGNLQSQAIAEQIRDLLISPAHARLTGRRIAEQARADGLDHVDIDMAMPREFSALVRQLHQAVQRADGLSRADQLLALASAPRLMELREWMTHEIVAQIEHGEAPFRGRSGCDSYLVPRSPSKGPLVRTVPTSRVRSR